VAVLKYHDGTGWEPVVSALQGPTGPTGVAVGLPTGGVTGAVLVKASEADYDTAWEGTTAYRFVETVYFTSSGTFTKASYPWLRAIRVKVQGAGGGGGGAGADDSSGGGGGGGAYTEKFITDIAGLSSSETITVGSAGSGGAAGNNAGTAGGNSSFGTLLVANGGSGGNGSGGVYITNNGGNASTPGDFTVAGGAGVGRSITPTGISGNNAGGDSFLGFGAKSRAINTSHAGSDTPAKLYGGGGASGRRGSSGTDRAGGDGADGIVIVELYA
jgi:hypothetical protein